MIRPRRGIKNSRPLRVGWKEALLAGGSLLLIACAAPKSHLARVDTDQDGQLDTVELKDALNQIVHQVGDRDRNGEMTFAELKASLPKANEAEFRHFDTDQSGSLSLDEFKVVLEEKKTFDTLLGKIDSNRDGIVDREEAARFYDAMRAAEQAKDYEDLERLTN